MSNADTSRRPGHEAAPFDVDPDKTTVLPPESFVGDPEVELQSAVANAEARAEEQRSLYLRALAELENYRKRAQRDVEQAHKYGLERFARDLLGVADSLEAGLAAATATDNTGVIEGQQATLRLLMATFQKFGITEIDAAGAPFDPDKHEAMAMQESPTAEPNSILQVVQKGYLLNGRLLRPARVIIARAPADKLTTAS